MAPPTIRVLTQTVQRRRPARHRAIDATAMGPRWVILPTAAIGQPVLESVRCGRGPRRYPEFGEDVREVPRHGLLADDQRSRDLPIGLARRDQREHLDLPPGEAIRKQRASAPVS